MPNETDALFAIKINEDNFGSYLVRGYVFVKLASQIGDIGVFT